MPRRAPPRTVTNSAADRAGETFRAWWLATPQIRFDDLPEADARRLLEAVDVIDTYRGMHTAPMTSVTMGIRSMVKTVRGNDEIRPGQRFKRFDRILEKLVRYPRMRLSQMEDIGGCRLVLPTIDGVYSVLGRIKHNWQDASVTDYIETPKPDGYRGIHVIKRRGGRLVEVQRRTPGQHAWAEAIEASSPRVRFNLKDGEGPADLREYFKLASERIYREEAGESQDSAAELAFATLRDQVAHYFASS